MADLTITVSNQMNVFGSEQPTMWGDGNWGTAYWGWGSNTVALGIEKFIDNLFTPSDALWKDYVKVLSESITPSFETTEETLQDSNGWYYVFTKPSTDAEDRNLPNYTEDSDSTTTWTEDTDSSTSWTEDT